MQKVNQTYKIAPADRLASVSEYYFSKKLKEVAQMNAEGKDVISLGIGSPDMPPSEKTIETLCNNAHDPNGHGYQPYVGIPELRKGFAAWYQRWYGVDLNPNTEIQPLIGSKEGILHVTLAFVNPGEQVLVPNPGYPTYTSLSKILGAEVINYDLKEEDGWMPDFETLENMDLGRVKLMWTNYPNMPTGANATPELYERLVDFARRKNLVIVNDNPYSFILNEKPISILSVPGAKECCIEFNSMSKSHNMPGWRIGMLASNPEFVQWILKVKSNIDSGMFRAMQLAAATALEAEADWYDGNNRNYRNRRHLAGEIMKALGCTYDEKQVGMFLWGKIPDSCKDVEELTDTFCLILAAYRVHASESGPYKAGIGGQIAGQAFGAHATAVTGQLHPGGKGILRLAGRKATVAVQNGHLLWERGIVGEDADGIIVNVQPIRHALHHNGAGGIGDEPVQGSGRQSLTEGGAGQIHAGQGGAGFPQIGAMGQNPGDEFKLGDIFLARGVGMVAGVAHEVQSCYGKALFVDRAVKKGRVLHHAGHTDHGVVGAHLPRPTERERVVARGDGHLIPVRKFIIQVAAKVQVFGPVGCCRTHKRWLPSYF